MARPKDEPVPCMVTGHQATRGSGGEAGGMKNPSTQIVSMVGDPESLNSEKTCGTNRSTEYSPLVSRPLPVSRLFLRLTRATQLNPVWSVTPKVARIKHSSTRSSRTSEGSRVTPRTEILYGSHGSSLNTHERESSASRLG